MDPVSLFMAHLKDEVEAFGHEMPEPHRSGEEGKEVSFEWWRGDRKVSLYFEFDWDGISNQLMWSWSSECGSFCIRDQEHTQPREVALALSWLFCGSCKKKEEAQ